MSVGPSGTQYYWITTQITEKKQTKKNSQQNKAENVHNISPKTA